MRPAPGPLWPRSLAAGPPACSTAASERASTERPVMPQADFDRAREHALERMARELSPLLVYHSLAHTRDDVVPAAERLAALEGVDGEDLLLLRTAAYYHDIGFVERREDHESAGIRIIREVLPAFGYSSEQVETVCDLVATTRPPQTPHNLVEQILADAD